MADSACYVELASTNGEFFTNSLIDDIMIRPEYATQKILIGTSNGQVPSLTITSNNVGIGTTTPGYKLDISGDINFTGSLLQNGTAWSSGSGSSSQWSNNSTNVFLLGSNVGIETSTPTEKFQVSSGKIYSDTQILSTSNDSVTVPAFSFKEDSNTGIFHAATDTLGFSTGGTERLRIDSTGNVGIGNASPSYKFDVNGVIRVADGILMNQNDDTYIGVSATNSAPALGLIKKFASLPHFAFTSNYGNSTSGNAMNFGMLSGSNLGGVSACNLTTYMTLDNAGNLGIGRTTPAYKLDVNGDIRAQNNGALISGSTTGLLKMLGIGNITYIQSGLTNVNNSAAPLVFGNIGNLTEWARFDNAGNFGISTTSPSYKLDVNGTTRIKGTGTNGGSNLLLLENQAGARIQFVDESNIYPCGMASMNTGNGLGFYATTNIGFFTTNALPPLQRMIVTQAGDVGIGTSSPGFKLDVNGTVNAKAYVGSNYFELTSNTGTARIGSSSGTGGMYLSLAQGQTMYNADSNWPAYGIGNSAAGFVNVQGYYGLSFGTQTNTTMTIGGAMVGIGTTTPTEKLHVASGKIYSDTQLLGNSNDSVTVPSFSFKEDSNTGIFHAATDALGITTGGAERLRVDATGNVGIGRTTPAYKLDVDGDIRAQNNGALISGTTTGLIRMFGVGNATYIQSGLTNVNNSAAPLVFGNIGNFTEWARFDNAGNLGISTTSPTAKLHVVGNSLLNGGNQIVVQNGQDGGTGRGIYMWTLADTNWGIYMGSSGATKSLSGGTAVAGYGGITTSASRVRIGTLSTQGFILENNAESLLMSVRASDGLTYFAGNATACNAYIGNYSGDNTFAQFSHATLSNSSGSYGLLHNNSGSTFVNSATGQAIRFRENNADIAIITGSKMGIGTASPTEKLHVVSGKIYSDTQLLCSSNDSASIPSFSFKENSNTGIFHPATDTLGITTAGTERLRVNASGSVGIGNTSPTYMLDINNATATSAIIRVGGTDGSYGRLMFGNASHGIGRGVNISTATDPNDVVVHTLGNPGSVVLCTGAGEGLRVNSATNVGIGNASPSYKLDVNGVFRVADGILMNSNDNTYIGINAVSLAPSLGLVKKSGASPHFAFTSNYGLSTQANAMYFGMLSGSNLAAVSACNLTTFMTLNNVGNFGVGITSPAYKLDVYGDIRAQNNGALISGTTTGLLRMLGIGNATYIQSGLTNVNNSAAPLVFGSIGNLTEWARFDNTGNFGIGTNAPSAKLYVNGNSILNGGNQIVVQNNQDGGTGRGIYMWSLADTNWGIYMGTPGASKSLSGGTAVAGYGGITTHAIRVRVANSSTGGFIVENSSEALLMSVRASDGLTYFAGNATAYNTSIGNSGHGAGYACFAHSNVFNTTSYCLLHANDGTTFINSASGKPIFFRENNADKVVITGGKIGIATNSPSYDLHVVGTIYATGDIIGFSDKRLKSNITIIDSALSKIHKLNGYTFNLQDDEKTHTGLIAQEVLEVLPEAVHQEKKADGTDGYYSLAYGNMAGLFVEAIKEIDNKYKSQITELQETVAILKQEIELLKNKS
jgi:Chaperone of endosialidase